MYKEMIEYCAFCASMQVFQKNMSTFHLVVQQDHQIVRTTRSSQKFSRPKTMHSKTMTACSRPILVFTQDRFCIKVLHLKKIR